MVSEVIEYRFRLQVPLPCRSNAGTLRSKFRHKASRKPIWANRILAIPHSVCDRLPSGTYLQFVDMPGNILAGVQSNRSW